MKTIMRMLLGISILFLLIGAVSANENTTVDSLQTMPEGTPLTANEEVTFINSEVDLEDKNATIVKIATTESTKKISIKTTGEHQNNTITCKIYKPTPSIKATLGNLNISYVGDYQITISSDNTVIWENILKVTADKNFSISGYSVTLSNSQYNDLLHIKEIEEDANLNNYNAGSTYCGYTVWREYDMNTDSYKKSLTYTLTKDTGKTVKQKIGIGYKWKTVKTYSSKKVAKKMMKKFQKKYHRIYTVKKVKKNGKIKYKVYKRVWKKIVTKNAKVYIRFSYGGFYSSPHKFTMSVFTNYQNAGENLISGAVRGYKVTDSFLKLKS